MDHCKVHQKIWPQKFKTLNTSLYIKPIIYTQGHRQVPMYNMCLGKWKWTDTNSGVRISINRHGAEDRQTQITLHE